MGLELRSRWWIVLASVLGLLVGNGPVMQFTFGTLLPSITRQFGWSRGLVSSAMVAGLWMTGIATPVVGRLVDRSVRPEGAALGTVLVGIGVGAEVDLIAFLLSRYLGMRSFGEIYGCFFSIFMLGAGLGPFAMGVSYDRTGSYKLMLVCFAFALALASLPMLRLGPYAYPTAREAGQENALAPAH
jgi:cyanate permease